MATRYTRSDPYEYKTAAVTGNWDDRHKSSRIKENIWQQSAIGNIEDFLSNVQWDDLGGNTSRLDDLTSWNQDRMSEIKSLQDWNQDRITEIGSLKDWNQDRINEIKALESKIAGWSDSDTWRPTDQIEKQIQTALTNYNKFSDLQTEQDELNKQLDTLGISDGSIDWKDIKNTPTLAGYVSKDFLEEELQNYYDNYLDDELTNRGITGLTEDQKSDLASISNVNLDNIRSEEQLKDLISSYGQDLGFGGTGGRSDTNILELVAKNLRDDDGNTIWERFAELDETNAADRITWQNAISSGLSNNLDYIKDTLGGQSTRNTEDIAALQETLSNFDYDTQIDDLKKQLQTQGLSLKNLNAAYKNAGNTSQITNEALKSLVNLTVEDKLQKMPTTDTTGIENAISMAQGDITNLKTEFAKLGIQDLAGTTDLETLEAKLAEDFGDSLTGLSKTYDIKIDSLSEKLGKLLTNVDTKVDQTYLDDEFADIKRSFEDKLSEQGKLQAKDFDLDLEKLKGDLGKQLATQAGQQSLNLANLGAELRGDVAANQQMFNQRLSDYSQTQARNFQALQTDWGRQLAAQEDALSDRIAAQTGMLNDRLAKIASSNNYRTLSNNAPGIKIRRSKAYKSGRTSRGTGQLGRSMRISTLNI